MQDGKLEFLKAVRTLNILLVLKNKEPDVLTLIFDEPRRPFLAFCLQSGIPLHI
jgi:hypothetical protein